MLQSFSLRNYACDGAAKIKVKGGTAPYTVVWNDGYIGVARNGLCKGTYTVTATDANGCIVVCTLKIKCGAEGTQITAVTSSSLITKDDISVAASPNPTKGLVRLSVSAAKSGSAIVNVYDMTGKKISTEKFAVNPGTNIKSINLSKYAKGFYNVEMIVGNGKKLVKVMVQ
ncbi:T9SS type A sorting domain-containing protein [Panacibacter ginsenosidivorans]|uniref:T9SS type A sorting domain-containing protein n=1 Tax=Panacibacter ginsenosidivorans TaxID=1813871 RepID=A0A5B8VA77_9BACT|nr:T9SS type A sorting domain-containing protein [Panacibacter ginsenosidivorans]QEC68252.1 T9SS type A sorting domain-containing protein [Panacibacter ginsenosidivorans]